jgi:hypothetical protein
VRRRAGAVHIAARVVPNTQVSCVSSRLRGPVIKRRAAAAEVTGDDAGLASHREAILTIILIAALTVVWLVVCAAVVALCLTAASADRLEAARTQPRTGARIGPRSESRTRE